MSIGSGWASATAAACVIGTFAATTACGVTRYQQQAKAAEARNALGQIGKGAAAAFEREQMPTVIAAGQAVGVVHALCATAANTVPSSAAQIKGIKYMSSPSDWSGSATEGWQCLHFQMDAPQYFMYGYAAKGASAPGDSFTATAKGDLNGDGVLSQYTLTGTVAAGGSDVDVAPSIVEKDPFE